MQASSGEQLGSFLCPIPGSSNRKSRSSVKWQGGRVKSPCLGSWRLSFLPFFLSCPYKVPRNRIKLPSESKPSPAGWGEAEENTLGGHWPCPSPAGCRLPAPGAAGWPPAGSQEGGRGAASRPEVESSALTVIPAAPAPRWRHTAKGRLCETPKLQAKDSSEQRLAGCRRKVCAKLLWCFCSAF